MRLSYGTFERKQSPSFVWKANLRTYTDKQIEIQPQPGILKAFQEIWRTDDLIASFDGINVSLPINKRHGRTDIEPTKAWPRSYSSYLSCAPKSS